MGDSILNIIINTVKRGGGDKEAVSGLKSMGNAFKQLTGFSLASTTAIGLAGMAAGSLVKLLKESVAETEQYVQSVTDQARVVGMDVEEMSRLIQATDDVFISQEKLEKSMLAATRRGIDVSREGLKKLSEEYLALDPKMERGYLLMQTFGRSGADMGKFMELGADGIDAAMDSISKSLIVTEQSRIDIENYKHSVDDLNDTWQGVKYTIGMEVIPTLDLFLRRLSKGVDPVEAQYVAIEKLEFQIRRLGGANGFSKEKVAELEAEIERLKNTAPGAASAIGDVAGEVGLVTQYFKDFTAEMIFNRLAANMDQDAQLELAKDMGLVNYATYNTIKSLDELTEKYDTNGDGVISLTEKTKGYNDELAGIKGYQDALKDKTVEYTIHITTEQADHNIGNDELQAGYDINGNGIIGKASGGPVSRNEPYFVGEKGIELFVPNQNGTIIPNNALGGTINNYFYGVSTDEVMRRLALQGVK